MHIGFNCLTLPSGEYSGVHAATRNLVSSVIDEAKADDSFTLYVNRRNHPALPAPDDRIRHIKPFWPVGNRTGRILYEQFLLHYRVFNDKLDLLHCPAYIMPHFCLKPVVLSIHDVFALRNPELCTRSNRSHFTRMMPKSIERAKRIIVPTEWVKSELLAYWKEAERDANELAKRTVVVPWGVSEKFAPITDETDVEEIRLRYGLPPKYALFIGRIEPKKNVKRIIEAYFAAVTVKKLPHRLVLAGPKGWGEVEKVKKTIAGLGISDKVIMPGFIAEEDLPAVYGMASLLIFPSKAEGFGFPVLEAMACGTPVVCSDIPALKEVAGDAAVFAPAEDLPALRVAIEKILSEPETAEEYSLRGQEKARTFTWKTHAEKTIGIYREVITEDKAR